LDLGKKTEIQPKLNLRIFFHSDQREKNRWQTTVCRQAIDLGRLLTKMNFKLSLLLKESRSFGKKIESTEKRA
jgi:hypothetical protein